jgi:pimeloyl-ACP methyl ester carboxylesterase
VARAQQAALAATPSEQWTGGGATPILIVQAADDTVAPPANAEALVRAYPDRVKVTVLPDAGHAMLPEQPQAIADLLTAYLRSGAR